MVRLKFIPSKTLTIITTFCIDTDMRAWPIVIKTPIYVWNENRVKSTYSTVTDKLELLTFTTVIVSLKEISSRTLTMITTFCVVTDMGTHSIVIKTLINICNENT